MDMLEYASSAEQFLGPKEPSNGTSFSSSFVYTLNFFVHRFHV